ncbi:ABC transporter ATP-binding protein [Actinoplanes sp. TBRC 11911]|uniref:ABC transporter ATP-binding protein n=1 Tax=Actinoplanes sp. TBRC 11911 TaxID=2729386 RepID=UPI00145DE0CE|nr:ABC transporter ATP-binding protein [Actinoplanes sp. TBRC 11911]NMO55967.1 ABC transporter ATP-binding protein [Actinoplanes sp. TBRC 11911]
MTGAALPIASSARTCAWFLARLREHKLEVAGTAAAGLAAATSSVVPVTALGRLVDLVRAGAPPRALLPIAFLIAGAALLGGVAGGVTSVLVNRLAERILAALREQTVAVALRLPATVLDRAGRGDLLSRVGADVAAVGRAAADVLPTIISASLLAALSVTAMFGLDWRLGLAGLAALPLYLLALRWYLPRSAPIYAGERAAVASRSQLLMESLQGVRTVHAYRLERRHLDRIEEASERAREMSVGVFTLFTRFVGRINRAELASLATILVAGFWFVRAGWVSVGETAAAAVLIHRLFTPVSEILYIFDEIQEAGAGLARLVGVGTLPVAPVGTIVPVVPDLTLDGVSFGYESGVPVLGEVVLRVAPGERVALVGSTGAGKTTVASIAAGILRPVSGTAWVGGVPVDQLAPGVVAIVSQETHVFAGALIDDVRLARPSATESEVESALDTVGALDWVMRLPNGMETLVGEGGRPLTSAQAQQLALARLVLLDPQVAILDEATAEAGSAGARQLEESAMAATKGRTTLLVAHRLTQAATADRVVVLEHGRVVEEGTHDDLVTAGGRYAELWSAWQSRSRVASPLRTCGDVMS